MNGGPAEQELVVLLHPSVPPNPPKPEIPISDIEMFRCAATESEVKLASDEGLLKRTPREHSHPNEPFYRKRTKRRW